MNPSVKTKVVLSSFLTPLLAFYEPISTLILPILWLVLFDIITGMYLARVVERRPLTSRAFFRKLPQVVMFLIAISAALHTEPFFVQLGIEKFQSSKWVVCFYGFYELFSILDNLGKSGLPVAKQISRILASKLPDTIREELPVKPTE